MVGLDDLLDDGESEAAPSGVAGTPLIQAGEPVEDALPVVLRDTGTVVRDGQHDS